MRAAKANGKIEKILNELGIDDVSRKATRKYMEYQDKQWEDTFQENMPENDMMSAAVCFSDGYLHAKGLFDFKKYL